MGGWVEAPKPGVCGFNRQLQWEAGSSGADNSESGASSGGSGDCGDCEEGMNGGNGADSNKFGPEPDGVGPSSKWAAGLWSR